MRYVTRINSFLRTGITIPEALEQIGGIDGVDYVDLNYPEHFKGISVPEMKQLLVQNHLKLNAINTRFREKYLHGVFDNSDEQIRRDAVDLSLEADAVCHELGGIQTIIWLPTDGYDYSFQVDYVRSWNHIRDMPSGKFVRSLCVRSAMSTSLMRSGCMLPWTVGEPVTV
jgi:xylose isomerase